MNMYFVQEAVYFKYGDDYYSPRIRYDTYWTRYLNHFKKVHVLARVKEINSLPTNYHKVNGDKVQFIELPFYNGILGYYRSKKKLNSILFENIDIKCAYVLRIPGPIGNLMARNLNRKKVNYAVEVVGDPHEVAKYLNLPKLIRFVLMRYSLKEMRKVVKKSIAAIYVTQNILQKKYPIQKGKISSSASNVILYENDIINFKSKTDNIHYISKRLLDNKKKPIRIGVLGMLYSIKAPLGILQAINHLLNKDLNLELYFAGDGPLREEIELTAKKLNISHRVFCLGNLASGDQVFSFLDSLDLYIQFSKTEGVPRAMLEAMARGCPIVSSNVGGIPELLEDRFLVKSGDVAMLSNKIKSLLTNTEQYQSSIEQNIKTAKRFTLKNLNKKRYNHYSKVYKAFKKTN